MSKSADNSSEAKGGMPLAQAKAQDNFAPFVAGSGSARRMNLGIAEARCPALPLHPLRLPWAFA